MGPNHFELVRKNWEGRKHGKSSKLLRDMFESLCQPHPSGVITAPGFVGKAEVFSIHSDYHT